MLTYEAQFSQSFLTRDDIGILVVYAFLEDNTIVDISNSPNLEITFPINTLTFISTPTSYLIQLASNTGN